MKFTHAIVFKIPNTIKLEDKKATGKIDLELAKKQQQELNDTLQEAGVELVEITISENALLHNLFVDDLAVVINGMALITRPKNANDYTIKVQEILKNLTWDVFETKLQNENGKTVILEGSDVIFTGKEIFVGVRKNGTNYEGAKAVSNLFVDFSVIPVSIKSDLPLKHYISVATSDTLAVSKSKESQNILHEIENNALFRYNILTLESDEFLNCINVNNHLVFRTDTDETQKFCALQQPTELWGVSGSELCKIGVLLSRFCLLVEKL